MKTRLLLLLITLIIASGCVSRKACSRKFPLTEYDSVSEIVKTVTIYRDTLIFIELQGDTVYRETPARTSKINRISTPLALSEAWIDNGKLKQRLIQKDSLVPVNIQNAFKTTTISSERDRKAVRINNQPEYGRVRKILLFTALIIVIALVFRLYSLFFR